jgi:hypothetical protein
MRTILIALALVLLSIAEAGATFVPEGYDGAMTVDLGNGVVLSRDVYDDLTARPDGWQIIERMQQRAELSRRLEGVPQLVTIGGAVLLTFVAALIHSQRKHARLHRTIQLMVERGTPLPPELLRAAEQPELSGSERGGAATATPRPVWASNLMWGGILWVFIGVTAVLWLWLRDSDAWPWGLAAIAYGVAAMAVAQGKRRAE